MEFSGRMIFPTIMREAVEMRTAPGLRTGPALRVGVASREWVWVGLRGLR